MAERLQKALAHQGLGSRRQIEQWILQGRLKVNGQTATLGMRVTPKCRIHIDNKLVKSQIIESEVLLYHKPVGEVCSRKPNLGEQSVFSHLPKPQTGRWLNIGRLDINTSGLLIFTTQGEQAHQWMHPSSNLEREYKVRVFGRLSKDKINQMKQGIRLEDGFAQFHKLDYESTKGNNHWFKVVLKEGRNRLVRRMFEAFDLQVNRLIRTRFGTIQLPVDLKPGETQVLSSNALTLEKSS